MSKLEFHRRVFAGISHAPSLAELMNNPVLANEMDFKCASIIARRTKRLLITNEEDFVVGTIWPLPLKSGYVFDDDAADLHMHLHLRRQGLTVDHLDTAVLAQGGFGSGSRKAIFDTGLRDVGPEAKFGADTGYLLSYESNNVADTTISLEINCERPESWLSQANRISERLNVTSNKENYALVKSVTFELFVKPDFVPRGYLFVCPPEDFGVPGTSSFRWPHCPAYWSFDRTGAERLSMEAANCHGFPPFELRTRMKLLSWDDSDYTGLREFHESWGFNPDSQDVARHLGDLIYKVSEEESTSDDEDSFDSPIQDLYEDTAQGLPSVHLATHCGPEEFVPLSRHSKVLMVVKLALILFIAVSSAYGGVPAQLD
ncbi:hypothetical protein B0H11DRAFT_2275640 [Mycena galericulata]|nr:hypothetical protein B0H11DRAFT_2275640 [Mycena galericulata]